MNINVIKINTSLIDMDDILNDEKTIPKSVSENDLSKSVDSIKSETTIESEINDSDSIESPKNKVVHVRTESFDDTEGDLH